MIIAILQFLSIAIGATILGHEYGASIGFGIFSIAYGIMPPINKE